MTAGHSIFGTARMSNKPSGGVQPRGEGLRRAVRWLSDEGRHDPAAIEEASRRFDLSPLEEEFLLRFLAERQHEQ